MAFKLIHKINFFSFTWSLLFRSFNSSIWFSRLETVILICWVGFVVDGEVVLNSELLVSKLCN